MSATRIFILAAAATMAALPVAPPFASALAQDRPISLRDSFPIGTGDTTLCQVQDRSIGNTARLGIFDRRWSVVCRDSALPVARVYAFRSPDSDPLARVADQRVEAISCPSAPEVANGREAYDCTAANGAVGYSVHVERRGDLVYIAEGLSVYDSATLLALESILADRIVEGEVDIATTSIADPVAFARIQAETLKPELALAEGYRRNLSGEYAEASAFFETLEQRTATSTDEAISPKEFALNRALQKSNLGEFAEADRLFARAGAMPDTSTVTAKLQRNFEAIHLLNQGAFDAAIERAALDGDTVMDIDGLGGDGSGRLTITVPISTRLNQAASDGGLFDFADGEKLTEDERAQIIDAQALQLAGSAQRIKGDFPAAEAALTRAYEMAIDVRDGRVVSIVRLRAQILSELALIAEASDDVGGAETLLRGALGLLQGRYPETRAVNGAQARLAAFLLRQGRQSEARAAYAAVVDQAIGKRGAASGLANSLAPYFRLLADSDGSEAEFFRATQLLVRPGVAETQAVLSRELSAGTDEAARIFRQSNNLSRSIERARLRLAAYGGDDLPAGRAAERAALVSRIDTLERDQQRALVRLAEYPQYRAVAASALDLDGLRAAMKPGEAYARVAIARGDVYVFYTDDAGATAYRTDLNESELDFAVDTIRASISVLENGQFVTYPFDIEAARALYEGLFGPVAQRLAGVSHLIFEPDGALLRLPINLLVADDASVAAYLARVETPDGDPYNFTGVNWLGDETDVSTAVSARAFTDARSTPASSARREYLGLGQNQPALGTVRAAAVSEATGTGEDNCDWSLSEWNKPIAADELRAARALIGEGRSEILTGPAFSDTAIRGKDDLADYRILHFATHGLVTAPKPSCPAYPALLTSFGDEQSDGLLTFDEIFDLKIDADLVILSACDTAGKASIQATREAGVSSGGGTALDGLVRSFIGAGGRSVLASHWPAPDDYDATKRLIGGLFTAPRGTSVATATRQSQIELMNDPVTSHPYYWAGFAIVGDGTRPILSAGNETAALSRSRAATTTELRP